MDPYSMLLLTMLFRTGMSLGLSVIHDDSLINNDLVHCTHKLIAELHGGVGTVIVYGTSKTSLIDRLLHDLFESDPPIPVIRTDTIEMDHVYFERIWLAAVDDPKQLESVMRLLRDVHHQRIIVCLTYASSDPLAELRRAVSAAQIKAITRNVMFVATNHETAEVWIMGVPEYSKENCGKVRLTQVGVYREGTLVKYIPTFAPKVSNLAGCQLSVLVWPRQSPYVNSDYAENPGGSSGKLVESLAVMMNFTPKYVWTSSVEIVLNHTVESDLNLLLDMQPLPSSSKTAASVSLSMVNLGFFIEHRKGQRSLNLLFIEPFEKSVWLAMAVLSCALLGTSFLLYHRDPATVMLKIFGSLLGIGIGKFPEVRWMKLFLWFWLLPSYYLTQCYLANLTKELTVPAEGKTINTLKELIDSKYVIPCSADGKRALSDSSVWPVELGERCQLTKSDYSTDFFKQAGRSGFMNKTARIENLEILEATALFTKLHVINDHLLKKRQMILVHSGNLYITAMEKNYNRLFASGLIEYWRKIEISKHRKLFEDVESVSDFDFILHSVGFLGIGIAMSFICFVAELIVYRVRSRRE